MVEYEDWVAKRVNEAYKANPSLADSAAARILELLKGKVMDRQLSTAELREIAKMLLVDVAPMASLKKDVTDAN